MRLLIAAVVSLAVGGWLAVNWPSFSASIAAAQRASQQEALEIGGVQFCPPTTARSYRTEPLNEWHGNAVRTSSDVWSPFITVNGNRTWTHADGLSPLCVLRILPDGELDVSYWPAVRHRPADWQPSNMETEAISFATPEGRSCVGLQLQYGQPYDPCARYAGY
jgi:hypothetical protein